MSLIRCQSSASESAEAYQDISSSCSSDQSFPCLAQQSQINDRGARNDHGLPSSFQREQNHVNVAGVPGNTGNLISEDDTSNQGPHLNLGLADDDSDVAELRMSVGSSSNVDHTVGVPGILGMQDNINSGSDVSISGLADQTREGQSGSRPFSEVGSSSRTQQSDYNVWNNFSDHLNASSSHRSSVSPWNMSHMNFQEYPVLRTSNGFHANSDAHPHLSGSIHSEMPQGNFNPGPDMSSGQNAMLFNPFAAGNFPVQFEWNPPQTLFQMWFSNLGSRSSPDMSRMVFPPRVSGLGAGSSTERRLLPDLQDHRQHHSIAVGRYGAFDRVSNHQLEHSPAFHQWPSLPWAPPYINQAGRQHTALDYSPWFSTWNGSGSGVWNGNFALYPYHATYGHLMVSDIYLQQSNLGQHPYQHVTGPLISQSGLHLERLGLPHTFQSMEAEIARGYWTLCELPQEIVDAYHFASIQTQVALLNQAHYMHPTAFRNPEDMFVQDIHRDMRLDVDGMSYEELLNLGEEMGNVETGLREETIMELLKRRDYQHAISNTISNAEICCICREEYVHGEDVGELNCSHEFHTECIKQWLVTKNTCPICKMKALGA